MQLPVWLLQARSHVLLSVYCCLHMGAHPPEVCNEMSSATRFARACARWPLSLVGLRLCWHLQQWSFNKAVAITVDKSNGR